MLADTHVRSGTGALERMLDAFAGELHRADVILHAGDVVDAEALAALARSAPVHAVLGNNDDDLVNVLPETVEFELAGVRVAMVHDSGHATGARRA